jgi:hypothetical protein
MTPKLHLSIFDHDREILTDTCILTAIQVIAREGYKPAIPTLIKFLDFKKPEPPGVHVVRHPGPTNDLYPAADAMAAMGEAAIPALKNVITADSDTSKIARINAACVLFFITENKAQVIRFTVRAARDMQHRDTADTLTELAGKMGSRCTSKDEEQCKDALKDQCASTLAARYVPGSL